VKVLCCRCDSRRLSVALLLLLLALLQVLPVGAQSSREWYDYYADAEKALREQKWAEAASNLVEAIRLKPDPGIALPTYGMRYVNYFPYLKLGIAYYNLGNYNASLQALDREEKAGAVLRSDADRKNLEAFRRLAKEAQARAESARMEGTQQVVDQNLQQARRLEQEGRLDDALAAASRASAADPSNREASALIGQLREKAAQAQRERDAAERRTKLVAEGRSMLAVGRPEEASNLFSQALAMRADSETEALLNEARALLREQIDAGRSAEERRQIIGRALTDARSLEAAQRYADAIGKLQTALALEPANAEARAMQERLSRAASEQTKLEEIARAMDAGVGYLQNDRPEEAAASFNWILARDPANEAARSNFLQALQQMNSMLFGGARLSPKIVPIIVLAGVPPEGAEAETVSSGDVHLAGTILDDGAQVTISVANVSGGSGEGSTAIPLKGQKTGNLYRFDFERVLRVRPGAATLRVTAVDLDKLTSAADRRVVYVRPWHRSPWTLGALAAAIALAVAGAFAWKARIRSLALKRRYNPFVAGTPVLKEEHFFGREPLIQRILQSVHNNSILLHGERRIGKTSIQHHLHKRLQALQDPEYEFLPVYVDLQGVPQDKFFATLAADIFHELGERIDPALAAVDPRHVDGYGYESFVRDMRAVLKRLKSHSAKKVKVVLLIDEVDELNEYDPRINQKLRSLFMKSFAEDLSAVVSGVAIKRQWESQGSPWYNFFEEIEVKPFTREDAVDLVEKPIRGIFDIDPGVTDRIVELTGCRPYLIQKLCMSVVSRLHEEKRRRITLDDVQSVELPREI